MWNGEIVVAVPLCRPSLIYGAPVVADLCVGQLQILIQTIAMCIATKTVETRLIASLRFSIFLQICKETDVTPCGVLGVVDYPFAITMSTLMGFKLQKCFQRNHPFDRLRDQTPTKVFTTELLTLNS